MIIKLLLLILILSIPIPNQDKPTQIVELIEYYSFGAEKVELMRVIDGDTVIASIQGKENRIRLVGYDAYELNEAKGLEAKAYLEKLCLNKEVYLEVDGLEPKDKYNRTLGYLWCKNGEVFLPITKTFLILRPDLVKRTLYIAPDEYPYYLWLRKINIKLISEVDITLKIYNITGTYEIKGKYFDLNLTGSYYKLRSDLFINATFLNLLKPERESLTVMIKSEKTSILTTTYITTEIFTITYTKYLTNTITERYTVTQRSILDSEILYFLTLLSIIIIAITTILIKKRFR